MIRITCPHCNYRKDTTLESMPLGVRLVRCPNCQNEFKIPEVFYSQLQKNISVLNKNMGLSILLTVLFGPLGMLYSTVVTGIPAS